MPLEDQTAIFGAAGAILTFIEQKIIGELLLSPRGIFRVLITPTVLSRSRMRSRSSVGRLGPSANARLEARREAGRIGLTTNVDMPPMWTRDP